MFRGQNSWIILDKTRTNFIIRQKHQEKEKTQTQLSIKKVSPNDVTVTQWRTQDFSMAGVWGGGRDFQKFFKSDIKNLFAISTLGE